MKTWTAPMAGALVMFVSISAFAAPNECATVFNPRKPGLFGLFGSKPAANSQRENVMDQLRGNAFISRLGTVDKGEVSQGLLPRGSALITTSGALKETGIISIIHAATGSMNQQGGHHEPTLESVKLSVRNSIALGEKFNHARIAIPLIGGGVFIERLGISPAELAAEIIRTARDSRSMIEIRLVAFGDADVQTFREGWAIVERENFRSMDAMGGMEINQGSITDFNVHRATAIVNAANTEVTFGGGLSGVIARATQNEQGINAEAAAAIESLRR